jgi:hypothetical protein
MEFDVRFLMFDVDCGRLWLHYMHKALDRMNLQIHHAISDIPSN